MVRARAAGSLAPIVFFAACNVELGIEEMIYRCDSDSQCASGFTCGDDKTCVRPSDAGAVDAGEEPCGFEEQFDQVVLEDWQPNGDATTFPGFVQLTTAESNKRGTVWHRERITADRFSLEMEFNIFGGGAEGGDGMAVAWIEEDASALGGSTANLGVYSLNGYLVELDTLANTSIGDPPSEHIAFARTRGKLLPDLDQEDRLGTATNVPVLRSQENRVLRVEFDMGRVEVFLDGTLVLTASTAGYQPFDATFGATAATGARSDSHAVHRLTLRCL